MSGIKEIPQQQILNQFFDQKEIGIEKDFILLHFGSFTDSKINVLLKLVEDTVLEIGDRRQIMRRLCSLLVEALQNTFNHGSTIEEGNNQSALAITYDEKFYYLTTGNLIQAEEIITITQRLNSINSMTANELRKLYIETLCNDNFNQKGGAGLGLLTMAKKVEGDLDFDFLNISKQLAFFTLRLKIARD